MHLARQLNATYVAVVEGLDAEQRRQFDRDLNETVEDQQRRAHVELTRTMGGPAGFNVSGTSV